MRQVGTSPGGANGFGTGGENLDGSGDHSGGQPGIGLRREGRDGAPGRDERREGGAPAAARSRAFEARIEEARRRLGRGPHRDDDRPEEADGAGHGGAMESGAVAARIDQPDRDGSGGAEARSSAGDPLPDDRPDAAISASVPCGPVAIDARESRRLLATAEAPADAIAALFAAPGRVPRGSAEGPAAESDVAGPSIERRIAGIAERVERAIAADLAAGATAPLALRIPLDGAAEGPTSLTIVATAQGLDITLCGGDRVAPTPELIRAAQGLAERLQRRLGRGSVRIFEGDEPERAATGWTDLSAILGRGLG